ncbi:MAG: hypothetical protein LBI43_07990 [Streptococcaceae bacterium]|jgi:hypothetical protein|nr:hypothetical protein [Streptococcaceae bacterium]
MAEIKIISNRDPKTGEFIDAGEEWTQEKIEALLKKYNPNGTIHYHKEEKAEDAD